MSPRPADPPGSAWHPIHLPGEMGRLEWLRDVLVRLNPAEDGWPGADARLSDLHASDTTDASISMVQPFVLYVGVLQLSAAADDGAASQRGRRGADLVEVMGRIRSGAPTLFRGLIVALAQRVVLHHILWGAHGALESALCLEMRTNVAADPAPRHTFRFVIDVPAMRERVVSDDTRWDIDPEDWRFLLTVAGWTPGPRVRQPIVPGAMELAEGPVACMTLALCTAAQVPTPTQDEVAAPRLQCDEHTFTATIAGVRAPSLDGHTPAGTVHIPLEEARERALAILSQEARAAHENRRFFGALAGPEWDAHLADLWRRRGKAAADPAAHRWHVATEQGGERFHVKLLEDNPVLRPLSDAERSAQDTLRRGIVEHPRVRVSRETIGRASLPFVPAARIHTARKENGLPEFHAFVYLYLGQTWREFVDTDPDLSVQAPPEARRRTVDELVARLFEALESLHRDARLVHGDIWTSNVQVWRHQGHLRLALVDFDQSMTIGLNPPLRVTNRRRTALQPSPEELECARAQGGGREAATGATPWFDVHVAARMVLGELDARPHLPSADLRPTLRAACAGRLALTAGEVAQRVRTAKRIPDVAPVAAAVVETKVIPVKTEAPTPPVVACPSTPFPVPPPTDPLVEPLRWERIGVYGILCALALLPVGVGLIAASVIFGFGVAGLPVGPAEGATEVGLHEPSGPVSPPPDTGAIVPGESEVLPGEDPPERTNTTPPVRTPKVPPKTPTKAPPAGPVVSTRDYRVWLTHSRPTAAPVSESGPMTNISAVNAQKYCKRRGGLAAVAAAPGSWTQKQGVAPAEWRLDAEGHVVILDASGRITPAADLNTGRTDTGFRCVR